MPVGKSKRVRNPSSQHIHSLEFADFCKLGDSFSTGDVLLEIETDKAQMDVEAQDDGKMAKITVRSNRLLRSLARISRLKPLQQPNGAKGVKVGSRIAILVEIDDDLSTLSLPDEVPSAQASSSQDTSKSSESQTEAPPSSKGEEAPPTKSSDSSSPSQYSGSSKPQKQTYPLYPSIAQLLHEKGLSLSEADKIPASGPKGPPIERRRPSLPRPDQ